MVVPPRAIPVEEPPIFHAIVSFCLKEKTRNTRYTIDEIVFLVLLVFNIGVRMPFVQFVKFADNKKYADA